MTFKDFMAKAMERHKKFVANMSDENALKYPMLFPEWKAGEEYKAGMRVRMGDVLYRVNSDHVAQVGLEPNICEKFEKIMVK